MSTSPVCPARPHSVCPVTSLRSQPIEHKTLSDHDALLVYAVMLSVVIVALLVLLVAVLHRYRQQQRQHRHRH